jgi:hypothetical protein
MMSLDQVVALQIDEQSFSLATMLRSAVMQGGFGAIDDYISAAIVASYAEVNGIAAGQEEIQEAVDDWRVENGLYQATEVRRGDQRSGLGVGADHSAEHGRDAEGPHLPHYRPPSKHGPEGRPHHRHGSRRRGFIPIWLASS